MSKSGHDTLDLIDHYMTPMRDAAAMEKVAAESSYQDSSSNTVSGNDKKNASDTQTNLGKEQSSDAKDGGSTVEDETDNNDSMGKLPADDQGTVSMDIDEPITQNGNIGTLQTQEISQTQKTASEQTRVTGLANAILSRLDSAPAVQKQASAAPAVNVAEIEAQTHMEKVASDAAEEYRQSYLAGLQARQRDEDSLQKNASHKLQIDAAGGVSALLDKIAMEDPAAILPPEALEGMPAEAPMDAAPMEEAPMEGGEGAPSDEELEMVASQLAEAGVAPEEIEKAIADLQEMQAAGVNPEDLAQALSEMEPGSEAGGLPAEAAPAEMAEAGGEVEKVASSGNRETIDALKAYILNK